MTVRLPLPEERIWQTNTLTGRCAFGHWKDTAVRLKGKAAERFTYMFLEMWNVTETKEEEYSEEYKTPEEFSMANDGFCHTL